MGKSITMKTRRFDLHQVIGVFFLFVAFLSGCEQSEVPQVLEPKVEVVLGDLSRNSKVRPLSELPEHIKVKQGESYLYADFPNAGYTVSLYHINPTEKPVFAIGEDVRFGFTLEVQVDGTPWERAERFEGLTCGMSSNFPPTLPSGTFIEYSKRFYKAGVPAKIRFRSSSLVSNTAQGFVNLYELELVRYDFVAFRDESKSSLQHANLNKPIWADEETHRMQALYIEMLFRLHGGEVQQPFIDEFFESLEHDNEELVYGFIVNAKQECSEELEESMIRILLDDTHKHHDFFISSIANPRNGKLYPALKSLLVHPNSPEFIQILSTLSTKENIGAEFLFAEISSDVQYSDDERKYAQKMLDIQIAKIEGRTVL